MVLSTKAALVGAMADAAAARAPGTRRRQLEPVTLQLEQAAALLRAAAVDAPGVLRMPLAEFVADVEHVARRVRNAAKFARG